MVSGVGLNGQPLVRRPGQRQGRERDWILWGVPLIMVTISSFLILSIERQEALEGFLRSLLASQAFFDS